MANGWRNRFVAPICALGFSVVLALILGFALKDPAPNAQTLIRFMIVEQSGSSEPAKDLKDQDVEVFAGNDRELLTKGPLNQSGEFTLATPNSDIRICARIPVGKFAVNVNPEANGNFCWVRSALGDVVITLLRLEG
jgi:hypothetical protein